MEALVGERERAARFRETCEDERAFRVWYDEAVPKVYGYLLARCGGVVPVAEELTQETFVEAVRHRHRFDGRSDPLTWVVSIARHKLADHFRRLVREERRHLTLVSAEPPVRGTTDDPIAAAEGRQDVLHALRALPAMQRAVLVYRYLDDLPVTEIAQRIGRSRSATQSTLNRARERFRHELGFEETGEDDDA